MSAVAQVEFELDETQTIAVDACCDTERRIIAISGSAGTGKTTILKIVYERLTKMGFYVVLCAPTGKAAKRIQEATGIEAMTMHRLLEYSMPGDVDEKTGKPLIPGEPKRDRRNPIEQLVVLADEYMMVNVALHSNLIHALPNGGLVRMFGDTNQLSPIESSKILKEKPAPFEIALEKFDGIQLKTIHRQAEDSNIILNGSRIVSGLIPRKTEDFTMKVTESPVEAVQDYVMDNLHNDIDFGALNNQIITVTNKGWIGTTALNGTIQALLQPMNKPNFMIKRHKWEEEQELRLFVGDKVLITKNNYGLEVFNGESGIVIELDEIGQVVIDLGDRDVAIPPMQMLEGRNGTYEYNPQQDIDLAYVITTHKSQGSEYDRVCYVMNKSRGFNLNRRNFYTGVSRARKQVHVITDQRALQFSLSRTKEQVFKSKS